MFYVFIFLFQSCYPLMDFTQTLWQCAMAITTTSHSHLTFQHRREKKGTTEALHINNDVVFNAKRVAATVVSGQFSFSDIMYFRSFSDGFTIINKEKQNNRCYYQCFLPYRCNLGSHFHLTLIRHPFPPVPRSWSLTSRLQIVGFSDFTVGYRKKSKQPNKSIS